MAIAQTRVGEVAYEEHGDGDPMLLLHATLHDRHDYDAVIPAFARDRRVIAIDWPSHGDSPAPRSPYMPSAMLFADVLEDFVDALELRHAVIVGNSAGGFAAARLAITQPDRARALVLVNNGGFAPMNAASRTYLRLMGSPRFTKRVMPRFVGSYMQAKGTVDKQIADSVAARARTDEGNAIAAALWRSFASPDHDLRDRAASLRAPTLIVWGGKDTATPLRVGRATHAAIAGSRFEQFDTGHVVFASDPEGFIECVGSFLRSLDHAVA